MKILIGITKEILLPSGPAYVAASLKRAGHQVTGHCYTSAKEFRKLVANGFDIFATGGICSQFEALKSMVDIAHEAGLRVIVGGGIVSSEPELMTRALGNDYSVLGQGEITAVELLDALAKHQDISAIPGLGFVRDGQFVTTPARAEIKDLDALPFPDHEVFDYVRYLDELKASDCTLWGLFDRPRVYWLVASRSCVFNCNFCWHTSGMKYSRRSIDSIMAEITEVVAKYRINILWVADELFSLDEAFLLSFCERFSAYRKTVAWNLVWFCNLHVSNLNEKIMNALRDSGCYAISYGFESYSQVVLTSMHKHTTPAQIAYALKATTSRKMLAIGNFIFSDRAETLETAEAAFDFWKKHQEDGVSLVPMAVCPNSPDYRYCIEKGLIKDRLEHIRYHLFDTINMTNIPDKDFYKILLRTYLYPITHVQYATVIRREPDSLTLQCPFCSEVVVYNNFRTRTFYRLSMVCRSCGKTFWVSEKLYLFLCRLVAALAPKHAYSFYAFMRLRRLRNRLKSFMKVLGN